MLKRFLVSKYLTLEKCSWRSHVAIQLLLRKFLLIRHGLGVIESLSCTVSRFQWTESHGRARCRGRLATGHGHRVMVACQCWPGRSGPSEHLSTTHSPLTPLARSHSLPLALPLQSSTPSSPPHRRSSATTAHRQRSLVGRFTLGTAAMPSPPPP